MNTVKQICLGMAMAGVIAGAGSVTATAVAYADPADSGANSDSPGGGADTGSGTGDSAPKNDPSPSGGTETTAPASTVSASPTTGTARDDAPPKKTRTRDTVRKPGEKTRKTTGLPEASAVSDTTSDNAVTLKVSPSGSDSPAPGPAAKVKPAAAVIASASALAAAPADPVPAPEPVPVPIPAPLVPATPATPTAAATSSTTNRSRSMSTSSGDAVAQIAAAPTQRVLVIGIDGTNLGRVLGNDGSGDDGSVNNGAFLDLMDESTTSASSIQGHTTISNPSWTTILTGVWDTKSGVINNIFTPWTYNTWPTVFDYLEASNRDIKTKAIADWDVITDIAEAGVYGADSVKYVAHQPGDANWSATDAEVTQETVKTILGTDPDYADVPNFLFTYLVQVDENGHMHGGASQEYQDALTRTNANLAAIMAAVATRESEANEQWTVLVVTDHGHQPQLGFGHGFQTPTETTTFVIARGSDFEDGKINLQYSIVDITPTVLSIFGVPQSADFDGVPLNDHSGSTVTPVNIKDDLLAAISDVNYPSPATQGRLAIRTIFASVPYFLDMFTSQIVATLKSVANQGIFLVSAIAAVAALPVQIVSDAAYLLTTGLARLIGLLTGAGVVGPTVPPIEPATAPETMIAV